ncbi:MAG: response regulator [Spirochaetia bacterium]|jgi:putative two-component system response regulator|nr:response regulator [Spirochaetia bacterium]
MNNVNKKQRIMLVDDDLPTLMIGEHILSTSYEVFPLPSAKKLFEFLENITPDIILLDILMPEMDGYETIKILKLDERFADIPVIFITAKDDAESELQGLSLGAIDYVTKPFSAPLLQKRIENHLLLESQRRSLIASNTSLTATVQLKTEEVTSLQNSILNTIAEIVEFRDNITGGHIMRTQRYLEILINNMVQHNIYDSTIQEWQLDTLIPSSQLHDVGKLMISDSILNKRGSLTSGEFEVLKLHTINGTILIDMIGEKTTNHDFLDHAKIFAASHHEKWDGTGYPYGLSEMSIPLQGRLMAIADVYDALISERPYKKPFTHQTAYEIICSGAGTSFDPILVDVFKQVEDDFEKTSHTFE